MARPPHPALRGLYVILDPAALNPGVGFQPDTGPGRGPAHPEVSKDEPLLTICREALAGGARLFQYRDKTRDKGEQYAVCLELARLCRENEALFFVNDHADIALAVGADGVHVGQSDTPVAAVRKIVPHAVLIGASTNNLDEARQAVADGADYVSVGRLFPTGSKEDTRPATLEMLHAVKAAVPLTVCAIGGINESNIQSVIDTGADMAAVISAIVAADDVAEATRRLVEHYASRAVQGETGLREVPYPPP
jgi:thiamine-phosphate diphosphorylase